MSSCTASCCICSPKASSASATSASLPTGNAPRYCHYAAQHLAQSHRRSNQKLPPLRNRTLFGVAPSVVGRWWSSNDLLRLRSNSVHPLRSGLPHETAVNNSKTLHGSPRSAHVRPATDRIPTWRPLSHCFRPSILVATPRGPPPPLP